MTEVVETCLPFLKREGNAMTVAEYLQQARDVLMENGWVQGHYQDDAGRVCMTGALRQILYLTHDSSIFSAASYILTRTINSPAHLHLGVAEWNDRPQRTFTEVIDAFDRAILAAKEMEAG